MVLSRCPCIEKNVYARDEIGRAGIGADREIERGAGEFCSGGIGAIGIGTVVEKPLEGRGLESFAGREDDGVVAVPEGVDVGASGDEKLHHGNAMAHEGGAHERAVAALMNVGAMVEHPFGDGEALGGGRLPGDAALGNPGKWAVFVVANGSAMQFRIASHHRLDAREVVGINGELQLADLLDGVHVPFELGPAGEAVETCDLKLCLRK